MRRVLLVLTLLVASLWVTVAGVYACGDKFLVVGRGVRYARPNVPFHVASILIYKRPDSEFLSTTADVELQNTLKQAGHRFRVVTGPEELEEALKQGGVDIVLADLADAPGLEEHLRSVTVKPAILPVVYNPKSEDAKAAKKHYAAVVKEPGNRNQLLAAIDETMNSKKKS